MYFAQTYSTWYLDSLQTFGGRQAQNIYSQYGSSIWHWQSSGRHTVMFTYFMGYSEYIAIMNSPTWAEDSNLRLRMRFNICFKRGVIEVTTLIPLAN